MAALKATAVDSIRELFLERVKHPMYIAVKSFGDVIAFSPSLTTLEQILRESLEALDLEGVEKRQA